MKLQKLSVFSKKKVKPLHKYCPATMETGFSTKFLLDAKMQKSHSQKSATFRFEKSAKNVKNNGPKPEKNIFNLLNLSQKYRKMLDCSTRY